MNAALLKLASRLPMLIPRALAGDPSAIALVAAAGLMAAFTALEKKMEK